MTYEVIVTYNKYEEHVLKSSYSVEARDAHEAKKLAKEYFSDDFGFDKSYIRSYIINEAAIEYKNSKP